MSSDKRNNILNTVFMSQPQLLLILLVWVLAPIHNKRKGSIVSCSPSKFMVPLKFYPQTPGGRGYQGSKNPAKDVGEQM